jgi:hypothetical protein
MLQVIVNDVWEISEAEFKEAEVASLLLRNTQTGESVEASYYYGAVPGRFLTNGDYLAMRPKEVMLLGKWLAKGAPR